MGLFTRRQTASEPMTIAERYNAAGALHGSAASVFGTIASDLLEAEALYLGVCEEASQEINRLYTLKGAAKQDAEQAKASALSILELVRGNNNA